MRASKQNVPIPYLLVDRSVEWTYERKEGDIVVHAETAQQALAIIRAYGFLITEPQRLKQTSVLNTPPLITVSQNEKEGIS